MDTTGEEPSVQFAVRTGGGVVRQCDVLSAGWSKVRVAAAVARGDVVRIRRSWLAVPDADPYLVSAARAGVVLTCVTQAKRLGLWVTEEDRPHVAAPSHAGGVRVERLCAGATAEDVAKVGSKSQMTKATVHWSAPLVLRHPFTLTDSIENVLASVARCQPFEAALAVWESALRRQLVDALELSRLPLSAAAKRLLAQASPFSDSGLETMIVPRLRWMKLRILPQVWLHGHRVDFLIGDRLVLQIDGGHHVGAQREQDIAHDAELTLRGFHVIRVGYWHIMQNWPWVQGTIMRAVAQGLHRAA